MAVTFDKVVADQVEADVSQGLTMAIANAIIAENSSTRVDGAVFNQHKYDARNTDLLVGDVKGVMTNVGFTAFNGSHGATVNNGKSLVLLGLGAGSQITEGTLDILDGTLRLGTGNTAVTLGGTVDTVKLATTGVLNNIRGNYTVDNLTGSGKVEATNTGTFNAKDFTLNDTFANTTGTANLLGDWSFGSKGQISLTGGKINTLQDNIFQNVYHSVDDPLHTIGINASIPESIKEHLTAVFPKYVPGEVAEDLIGHASFTGGQIMISGVDLTTTMRDDLTTAFKETFDSIFPRLFSIV